LVKGPEGQAPLSGVQRRRREPARHELAATRRGKVKVAAAAGRHNQEDMDRQARDQNVARRGAEGPGPQRARRDGPDGAGPASGARQRSPRPKPEGPRTQGGGPERRAQTPTARGGRGAQKRRGPRESQHQKRGPQKSGTQSAANAESGTEAGARDAEARRAERRAQRARDAGAKAGRNAEESGPRVGR